MFDVMFTSCVCFTPLTLTQETFRGSQWSHPKRLKTKLMDCYTKFFIQVSFKVLTVIIWWKTFEPSKYWCAQKIDHGLLIICFFRCYNKFVCLSHDLSTMSNSKTLTELGKGLTAVEWTDLYLFRKCLLLFKMLVISPQLWNLHYRHCVTQRTGFPFKVAHCNWRAAWKCEIDNKSMALRTNDELCDNLEPWGHCNRHPELVASELVLWYSTARPAKTKLLVYVTEGSWDKL